MNLSDKPKAFELCDLELAKHLSLSQAQVLIDADNLPQLLMINASALIDFRSSLSLQYSILVIDTSMKFVNKMYSYIIYDGQKLSLKSGAHISRKQKVVGRLIKTIYNSQI